MNPPALLDAAPLGTASGAIAVAGGEEQGTASATEVVVVKTFVAPFRPVPSDEFASAPVEDPIDFEHGLGVLTRANSVDEADSPSAVPGSPFGV